MLQNHLSSSQGNLDCELPPKQRTAIFTIMDTSGTTGEPKGLIITNAAFMSEVLSTDHLLFLTDRVVNYLTHFTFSTFSFLTFLSWCFQISSYSASLKKQKSKNKRDNSYCHLA